MRDKLVALHAADRIEQSAFLERVEVSRTRLARFVFVALSLSANAFGQERYALLVGANAGWSDDRPLAHAESDAERVQQALIEVGGFKPERIELLRDPDGSEVRARLRRLSDRARASPEGAIVFFYYSGHADQKYLHLRGMPLGWDELVAALRDMPARVRIGLFDACRSGSVLATKGGAPTALFEAKAEEPVQGMALITSSGADELSQETRAMQGSVFTHHFVSGLRGAADFNHDGRVTLGEAYRYSYERTEADTAATAVPQRPAFRMELKGQGELTLSEVTRAGPGLVLPAGPRQRYVIVDSREWKLVAEGVSRPESEVVLFLGAGDYRVKRVTPDALEVASVHIERIPVSTASLTFTREPLSVGFVKGRPEAVDPIMLREYRRAEGLRLLAMGETGAARAVFEGILADWPGDVGSVRGKARAYVREAETWERVGDHARELVSLQGALGLEPTLAEDPDFTRWYRRMVEAEAEQKRDIEIKKNVDVEISQNPRLKKRWGLGIELFGTRGNICAMFQVMFFSQLVTSLSISAFGPGMDLSVKWVPLGWRVSPWIQLGGYYNLSQLWNPNKGPVATINGQPSPFIDSWNTGGHADIGVQYFGTLGFVIEGGIGVQMHMDLHNGGVAFMPWPNFAMSWFF